MSGLLTSAPLAAALAGDPIRLVDAGARGEPDPPWRGLDPGVLEIIGFEPDAAECDRLNAAAGRGRRYLPVALWSAEQEVEINVAATPSCSSVRAPDLRLLERYAPPHVDPRRTTSVVRYPARTLDAVLAEHGLGCDVLKIDVQGSESDVLQGATQTLAREVDVAIVETWTVPVHSGQGTTAEVLELAAAAKLSLFDIGIAAAWERRASAGFELAGKRQITGLDLLLIRDPADWPSDAPLPRRAKAAAVAEAFGFPDVAYELVGDEATLREVVLDAAQQRAAGRRGAMNRVRRVLGRVGPEFAPLHA